ncbi:protein Mis18-alpha [Melanotaenia boesemani]|uniref:protein Mis18-alpha n=1 Tax=Melanotaenia boesemani TaxID=1250792 RepID=UPI001C04171F|nr:protein Mis18-alpha [Melanotaenia boesemani]
MATVKKLSRHRLENQTFERASVDSSTVEEKLFGKTVQEEEEDDDKDDPVVFICVKCRLPVGDSLSWDGCENDQNQIRLKRVTENVVVGKENRLFEVDKRSVCLVVDLICRGCRTVLGMVYTSTPKNLDHKRFTFCLSVAEVDSYVLGSAGQMLSAEGANEQLVTLEYRSLVEHELTEMKMLVMSMAQRLEEIEAGLQEGFDEV